ncbi:MAG: DNA topoisomerase I [Thaumarchaeota archaeon]|nr:DNA topoisomerase I [Nitrososphaerota archaeon]
MPEWKTFRHNGIAFPPPYNVKGLPVIVNGQTVALSVLGEEMAYNFAKKKDTPYVQDPVFVENFMKYFSKELPGPLRGAKFSDIDLSRFYGVVDQEKRMKEAMTKDAKKSQALSRKTDKEALKAKYGKAFIDGKEVDIANWLVEPPGLFMGRGAHPLRGSWKPRVDPADVVLNLDKSTPPPEGWKGKVVHDPDSIWIAKWEDRLTEKEKYVWPHEGSEIQQSRNKQKYDKAQKVGSKIGKLRKKILTSMGSKDLREAKVATVCYLIDNLGMRVGDEKDEDEADTVGATTLRVEHLKIGEERVELDFLGKDSVRWIKTMEHAEKILVDNLRKFTKGKKPDEEIFEVVTSTMVNQFLSGIVPETTAKVFRTFHASVTTEKVLRTKDVRESDEMDKLYFAKEANLAAAIFCNHKRTPPKNWDEALKKKEQKLEEYKAKGKESMVRKMSMNVEFTKRTKDYNLGTSMKNYIDPRIYRSWCDYVGLDWGKLYTTALQRKFSWAAKSRRPWSEEQEQEEEVTVEQN